MDQDALTAVDGVGQTFGGDLHARHEFWLVQVGQALGGKGLGLSCVLDPPQRQQRGGEARYPEVIFQLRNDVVGCPAGSPRAASGEHLAILVVGVGCPSQPSACAGTGRYILPTIGRATVSLCIPPVI